MAYYEMAVDELTEGFWGESTDDVFSAVYDLFQALETEEQQMIIGDLRRIENGYSAGIEQGQMTAEEMGFDPVVFEEAAVFVETGTAPEQLRAFVEEEL